MTISSNSIQTPSVFNLSTAGAWTAASTRWGYQYSLPFMGGSFEKLEAGIETDLAALDRLVDANTCSSRILRPSESWTRALGEHASAAARFGTSWNASVFGRTYMATVMPAFFGRPGRHLNVAPAGRERAMILELETMEHQIIQGR